MFYERAKLTGVLYEHRVIFTVDGRTTVFTRKFSDLSPVIPESRGDPDRGGGDSLHLIRQPVHLGLHASKVHPHLLDRVRGSDELVVVLVHLEGNKINPLDI